MLKKKTLKGIGTIHYLMSEEDKDIFSCVHLQYAMNNDLLEKNHCRMKRL
jgi:hypothetical protein